MTRRMSVVLLVGSLMAAFGLGQTFTNPTYEGQLEAHYQRAFRELAVHLDGMEQALAAVQVASTTAQQAAGYADLLRLLYAAQANIGQLPVRSLQLDRVEQLLADVQQETVQLAEQVLCGDRCVDERHMPELYEQVKFLNQGIQTALWEWESTTSWLGGNGVASLAMSTEHGLMKSLAAIEHGLGSFPRPVHRDTKEPEGQNVSHEEAVYSARQFLGDMGTERSFAVVRETKGLRPTFVVEAVQPGVSGIMVEVNQYDGEVLWMTHPRSVAKRSLDQDAVTAQAVAFLAERGFSSMELVARSRLENRDMLTLAYVDEGVYIYPKQVRVHIAGDDGSILAFHGADYHKFHWDRSLEPALSRKQARERIRKEHEVVSGRLAVILNARDQMILVYEFLVERQGEQFLVYINADHGHEEMIVQVGSHVL